MVLGFGKKVKKKNEIDLAIRTKEPEEDRVYGDVYDMYAEVIKVHSGKIRKDMSPDFTLSHLSEKEILFVRTHFKLMIIVIDFFGNDKKAKPYCDKTISLLLRDVYSLVVMSRARGGRVLNAVLTYGRTKEEAQELKEKSIWERIAGRKDE